MKASKTLSSSPANPGMTVLPPSTDPSNARSVWGQECGVRRRKGCPRNFWRRLNVTPVAERATAITMFTNRILCGLLPLAILTGTALAQDVLYEAGFHQAVEFRVGESMGNLGDVDGDGVDDFLIGMPHDGSQGGPGAGAVHAVSGVDGVHLYGVNGRPAEELGEVLRVLGDVNGDGVLDWAVGLPTPASIYPQEGTVRVFSGSNGWFLYSVFGRTGETLFGTAITDLPDWDGDGIPDWAVSTLGVRVQVLSGADGTFIKEYLAGPDDVNFGADIESAGDWNGDGAPDLAIGNPNNTANDLGIVFVYSGAATGNLLRVMSADAHALGTTLERLDDWNGDGVGDWGLIDPDTDAVFIHSGADGRFVRRIEAAFLGGRGTLHAVGDVNGDGIRDIAVANSFEGSQSGSVRILAGGSGLQIMTLLGERAPTGGRIGLGRAVIGIGDVNSDGYDDFVVSKRRSTSVTVYGGGLGSLPGDVFENPIPIAAFGSVQFDTRRFGASGFPREGACEPILGRDVFFLWYPEGRSMLKTEGSSFDTILSVIGDASDTATCVLSNDDMGLAGRFDSALFDDLSLGFGIPRIVRVGGDVREFGQGQLSIEESPFDCPNLVEDRFAGNQDCASAYPMPSQALSALVVFDGVPDYFSRCVPPGGTLPLRVVGGNYNIHWLQASLWLADSNECGNSSVWSPLAIATPTQSGVGLDWVNRTEVTQRVVILIETSPGIGCVEYWFYMFPSPPVVCMSEEGQAFCGAQVNSTGQAASLQGRGSNIVADNELELLAKQLPVGQAIYFLASQGQGLIVNPGGSQGNLCLGGGTSIARLQETFGISYSGYHRVSVPIQAIPDPAQGLVAIRAGETWNFQGWYRDGSTSNFTPGLSVVFQ